MSKSEVQSLVTLISSVLDVVVSLLLSHSTPFLFSLLVSKHVVCLCKGVQCNGKTVDGNELHVAAVI